MGSMYFGFYVQWVLCTLGSMYNGFYVQWVPFALPSGMENKTILSHISPNF